MIKNIKNVRECPSCCSENIVHNEARDQVVCQDCGEIFEPLAPKDEVKLEKGCKVKLK
jgi:ribosomal protein S27E